MSTLPPALQGTTDALDVAIWLSRRVKRWKVVMDHPLGKEILGRMIGGESCGRIAAWVQASVPADDPLGTASLSGWALNKRLLRLRGSLPESATLAMGYLDQKWKRIDVAMDELTELDALIRYQKFRIGILASREPDFQVPVEQQGREVDRLADLLMKRRVMVSGAAPLIGQLNVGGQQINVATQGPQRSLATFMRENPAQIPRIMSLFDQIDELEAAPPAEPETNGKQPADG